MAAIALANKVEYLGRMVDKDTFRAFVYGSDGAKKLAKSWSEYQALIATGVWHNTVEAADVVTAPVAEKPVLNVKK